MKVPAIEYASKGEIEAYQEGRLQEAIRYAGENSAFYKTHFEKHQIDISEIKKVTDLAKIPAVSKKDLQEKSKAFYCVGPRDIIDYCSTSGTEGEAITIPLSEKDLERLAYNEAISFLCAGGSRDEIYQLTTTVDRRFMAGLAYVLGAKKIGAGMVRVGPGIPELQWKTILEVEPTALIVVPSFLLKLIEYAEVNQIDFRRSSVKKAICIGDPIREEGFHLNPLGRRIAEKWDIELYSTYASTEMATAFTECQMGRGGHFHPELIITELLDEQGNPVAEGEAGELTVTTLGIEALPLIRFRTGDICKRYDEKCDCGRNTYRIGPILGRKNQVIKYKGTTLYPPVLGAVMDNFPEIESYVIEVAADAFGNDEIFIKYVAQGRLDLKKLKDQFRTQARVTPTLEQVSPEVIAPLLFPKLSRKPVKFIDRRTNRN